MEDDSDDDEPSDEQLLAEGLAAADRRSSRHLREMLEQNPAMFERFLLMMRTARMAAGEGRPLGGGDGPATRREIELLGGARGVGGMLRQLLALQCSRSIAALRQLEYGLPAEVLAAIAESACGDLEELSSALCGCPAGYRSRGAAERALSWSPLSSSAEPVLAVCAECGQACVVRCAPRVMPLGAAAGWRSLGAASVLGGAASFKACRHFMLEPAGCEAACAVRHRMSQLHSFRTIVASEWVACGRVTYELEVTLGSRSAPVAIGVGCVAPHCDVNSDTAWAPGTRGWEGCWGFCVEEPMTAANDRSLNEIRALHPDFRAVSGGNFAHGGDTSKLCVRSGDLLRATIDTSHRVHGRMFELEVWRAGARVFGGVLAGIEPHREPAEPLGLAVALKYAHDSVRLRRLEPAPPG